MRSHHIFVVCLLLIGASRASAQEATATAAPQQQRIVGYYRYYDVYEGYPVTSVPAADLTHLIYAYVDISEQGQCVTADRWADTQIPYPGDRPNERLKGNIKQLQLLRQDFPELKILMSIGGWERSARFSQVALTRTARIRFANSCVAFMRQYGFDGIDVDWRFPVSGGAADGLPEDVENYPLLVAELRGQLDYWSGQDSRRYLLTMSAPASPLLFDHYRFPLLLPSVDWFNLLSYGFQGDWSEVASHHAPLRSNARDPRGEQVQQLYNVAGAVGAYLDQGIPADRLVVGIGFFAQTWQNVRDNGRFGLYAPAGGVPEGTRPGGLLYYRDLAPLLDSRDYIKYFDDEALAAWMYSPAERVAISYEDPVSVAYKVAYVRQMNLGGVALWELSFDDANQTLTTAVAQAFALQTR